jgi:DinB superfamily
MIDFDKRGAIVRNPALVISSLERAPALIVPLVREVPAAILKRRPKFNKWSAHEHACHLATVHPVMSARLDLMLSDPHARITPYFPDGEEEDGSLLKKDLDEEMERFSLERQKLVERLRGLSAEDWQRTAEHGEYNHYSVFIMFRHLALHDMLHAYRIEELLLKRNWE